MTHGVDRDTAPVKYAEVARIHDRTLQRWRGVHAFITQGFKVDPAQHLVEWSHTPHVTFGQYRRDHVQVRTRLCRCSVVTFYSAARGRDLGDRHNGFASATVHHVDAALFGGSQQGRFHAIGGFQVHQGWLTTYVHVPQVMVSKRTVPADFTGVDVQSGDASGIALGIFGTVAAVLVRRLVAHRQVQHAEVFVDSEHRPHVGRVTGVGFAFSNRSGFLRVTAVPVPDQLAGTYVVRTDHARRLVVGNVVGHVAANHDQIFGHGRWRSGVVTTRCKAADIVTQVYRTIGTEVFAHFTGVGVQGDQTGVGSRQEQATRARVAGCGQ